MTNVSLKTLQQQMINYLMANKPEINTLISDTKPISKEVRLNIYKNAYKMRLQETIDNDHQMLGLYLGDNLFEQMVTGYISAYPSTNTSLRHFADQLPQFLAQQSPFDQHPILSELAHFERMLMIAFDAADASRFTRELLLNTPHEQWPELSFRFHPSVQLCHFHFNAVETWQALKQEQTPAPAQESPNTWLLWRNYERLTQFRSLDQQELALIEMMLKGANFTNLCDYLIEQRPSEDISPLALNYLLTWVDEGILQKPLATLEQPLV